MTRAGREVRTSAMSVAGVVDLTAENPMLGNLAASHHNAMEENDGVAGRPFQFIVYPPGDPDAITLTVADVERLNDGEFLNDSLIDFWCRYVTLRMNPETRERFHIFNSYLFTKLMQEDSDLTDSSERPSEVLSWVKNVDVFSKDFLLIPICERMHWSLAVVCYPFLDKEQKLAGTHWQVPCILHLNSIRKTQHWVPHRIRKFLQELWNARHAKSKGDRTFDKFLFPGYYPSCPQQENEWDCGIFLIEYMERMCIQDDQPTLEQLLHIGDPNDFFVKSSWFRQADLKDRRVEFREILDDLQLQIVPGAPSASSQSPRKQTSRKHLLVSRGSADEEAVDEVVGAKKPRTAHVEPADAQDLVQPSACHYICLDDYEHESASTSVMCGESRSMDESQECEEVLPVVDDDDVLEDQSSKDMEGGQESGGNETREVQQEEVCIDLSDEGDGDRSIHEVPED